MVAPAAGTVTNGEPAEWARGSERGLEADGTGVSASIGFLCATANGRECGEEGRPLLFTGEVRDLMSLYILSISSNRYIYKEDWLRHSLYGAPHDLNVTLAESSVVHRSQCSTSGAC